ncbi:sensor histidine kinase [Streptomyces ovatisporus]|uniref:histidine kinase n=1 Tax=Streptomyces ovatisporus TaxID=1128682 RepID=A0ABV8ZZW7_9ACTN
MTDRPWHRRHRVALDVTIAVLFTLVDTVATVLGASWWPERPGTLAWVMLVLQAAACLSLAFRRRAPLAVVTVLGAFTLAVSLLIWPAGALTPADGGQVWAPFSTALAAYGPLFYQGDCRGVRRNRRRAVIALVLFTLVVARPWQPSATIITIGLLRTAVGPLLAMYFDARKRLVQALTERAERAERERHLLAEHARAEERARLAGEMHDVVTHRVSLMALQAGALQMTAEDEATRQAAEELRAAGCQALEELRDLVGILRTEPEGDDRTHRTPSVAGLAELVAESSSVGVPTELIEDGDPALASPVVGRTAYRLVREALTNVRKHAPGARVVVRVSYGEAQVRVAVRNTAPTAVAGGSPLAATGSGLGIPGLRRRIELVHGTLRAGRAPDGGFSIEATLPSYVPTAETAV